MCLSGYMKFENMDVGRNFFAKKVFTWEDGESILKAEPGNPLEIP